MKVFHAFRAALFLPLFLIALVLVLLPLPFSISIARADQDIECFVLGGLCQDTRTEECIGGTYRAGLCPNLPDHIRCCVPAGAVGEAGAEQSEEAFASQGLRGASSLVEIFGRKAFGSAPGSSEPEVVVGRIIQGLMVIIGVIFGILIVYGGYLWMIARGNEETVKKSISILQAAIIGFIIVVAAYVITNYVIDKVIRAAFQ